LFFGVYHVVMNFKESFKGLIAMLVLIGVYVATIVAAASEVTGILANSVIGAYRSLCCLTLLLWCLSSSNEFQRII
jgi:hypothetical protein